MKRDTSYGSTESTNRRYGPEDKNSIETKPLTKDLHAKLPSIIPNIKHCNNVLRKCSYSYKVSSTTGVPPLHNNKAVNENGSKRYDKTVHNYKDVKTIVQVDPQFYSIVACRPIKQKDNLRSYKNDIQKVLISRITTGYLQEELLKTERAFDHEVACYNKALKQFNDQEKTFQKFLAHDHDTAQTLLTQAREVEGELSLVTQEYEHLAYQLAKVKSQITFMNEERLLLLSYEKFLHRASPRQWKDKNLLKDYINIPPKIGELSSYNLFINDLPEVKTVLESVPRPKLHFKTPNELISLFEMLQAQNLFYLLIAESADSQKTLLFRSKEKMRLCFDQEVGHSEKILLDLTDLIEWLKMQAVELRKEVIRILNKNFRDYVASELILKMHTHVEFVYKRIVAKDLMDMTALEMMQDLETEYNIIINDLEVLDHDVVKSTEKKSFADDLLIMKRACRANEQLKNFTKVQSRLQKSFSLPVTLQPKLRCLKASESIEKSSFNRVSASAQNRLGRISK